MRKRQRKKLMKRRIAEQGVWEWARSTKLFKELTVLSRELASLSSPGSSTD